MLRHVIYETDGTLECILYTREKDIGGEGAGFMKDSMSTNPWFKDVLPDVSHD